MLFLRGYISFQKFKKYQDNNDVFKKLINRLFDITAQDF